MRHNSPSLEMETVQRERLSLASIPNEMAHMVCCRAPEWKVGLCGEEGGYINLAATVVCSMCVEVAERMLPGFLLNDPPVCPVDARPCPDEHDVDLRILREVSPE